MDPNHSRRFASALQQEQYDLSCRDDCGHNELPVLVDRTQECYVCQVLARWVARAAGRLAMDLWIQFSDFRGAVHLATPTNMPLL